MHGSPDPLSDAGWSAVHALVERWALLPPSSWRMLLSAERIRPDASSPLVPPALDRWIVRDLVETAWTMANHLAPVKPEPWTEDVRSALERLAWRLLTHASANQGSEPLMGG